MAGSVSPSQRQRELLGGIEEPIALHVPTYKQAVYVALRDMIVELDILPGTRLVESELAARLGVSKTPVREAIGLLETDGLIEVAPYRGATVRWLSVEEMHEGAFLIDAIEMPALPLVVKRITKVELAAVGGLVRQLELARSADDGPAFRKLTAEIHLQLFGSIGYPRLDRFISIIVGPINLRYDRVFCQFDDAWDVQLELIVGRFQGIKRGDPDEAAAAVRRGRARMAELNMPRLSHPLVAPLFGPAENGAGVESSQPASPIAKRRKK